jgi:beta-lactam-binding protein with PASTA domain
MRPSCPSRRSAIARAAFALLCALGAVPLHAQDTLKIPATSTPRVNLPAGTRVTRPPITVAQPAGTAATQQEPAQQLVRVPDLGGRTVEEARRLLAAAGLEVGRVAEGTGEGTPGTIMQQQPRAGSVVAPKSDVRLWLVPPRQVATRPQEPVITIRPPVAQPQQGPARVTVPRVIGRTPQEARTALAAAGLEVGAVAEVADGGAPGTVVRQYPAAGAPAEPKSQVRLWVVPMRVAQAPPPAKPPVAAPVETRPDPPATQPPVHAPANPPLQVPAAQTPAAQSPTVRDSAAPGTEPDDLLIVPDVRRLALREARANLESAGLAVALDAALADSAAWTVRAQQPGPGARVAAGEVVALLLDPPAPGAVAGTANPTGSVPGAANGFQPPASAAQPWFTRRPVWIGLAVLLLIAAALGARQVRGRGRALPVTAVSARLRMDAPARVAVEGAPFAAGGLRLRMNPGRTAARVSAAGPLFVQKEVSRG